MIAEAEGDLALLFEACFSSLGIITETSNTGVKTLDCFFECKKNDRPYDTIILDTHLSNPKGLDIAKRIRSEEPNQKLILVTTTPRVYLPQRCLKIAGIKDKDILIMPFRMSMLVSILKNQFVIF